MQGAVNNDVGPGVVFICKLFIEHRRKFEAFCGPRPTPRGQTLLQTGSNALNNCNRSLGAYIKQCDVAIGVTCSPNAIMQSFDAQCKPCRLLIICNVVNQFQTCPIAFSFGLQIFGLAGWTAAVAQAAAGRGVGGRGGGGVSRTTGVDYRRAVVVKQETVLTI